MHSGAFMDVISVFLFPRSNRAQSEVHRPAILRSSSNRICTGRQVGHLSPDIHSLAHFRPTTDVVTFIHDCLRNVRFESRPFDVGCVVVVRGRPPDGVLVELLRV